MTLWEVWCWAAQRGFTRSQFTLSYKRAFYFSADKLLQSIWREYDFRLVRLVDAGGTNCLLTIGNLTSLEVRVSEVFPFRVLRLHGNIWVRSGTSRHTVCTVKPFLSALSECVRDFPIHSKMGELASDFQNGVANLILTRLLALKSQSRFESPEPIYRGHTYYPFPGLRVGPTLQDVEHCSNLVADSIKIPVLKLREGIFISQKFSSPADCFAAWSGHSSFNSAEILVPIHPWQLSLSLPLQSLLLDGTGELERSRVIFGVPLASQRTLRVKGTNFDLKLSIDATITGEHRLLYPINRYNAPAVGTLARQLKSEHNIAQLDFQNDIASLAYPNDYVGSHVSAIVREPISVGKDEMPVPAVCLWGCKSTLIQRIGESDVVKWFYDYCQVVMRGPIVLYLRGFALEPHLQNTIIIFRSGQIARIVVRDLDGAILDSRRVLPVVHDLKLVMAADTWRSMPSFEVGGKRLAHALFFGHLAEAIATLRRHTQAPLGALLSCMEQVWGELDNAACSGDDRISLERLREYTNLRKEMLTNRLNRTMQMSFSH